MRIFNAKVCILRSKLGAGLAAVSTNYLFTLMKKSYMAVKFAGKIDKMNRERAQKQKKKKKKS